MFHCFFCLLAICEEYCAIVIYRISFKVCYQPILSPNSLELLPIASEWLILEKLAILRMHLRICKIIENGIRSMIIIDLVPQSVPVCVAENRRHFEKVLKKIIKIAFFVELCCPLLTPICLKRLTFKRKYTSLKGGTLNIHIHCSLKYLSDD